MPARSRDLATIPTFLRESTRASARPAPAAPTPAPAPRAAATLPRPVTPPPARPQRTEPRLDPASLPMPSLSRRRVITAAGVLLAGWLTISFVRQVGEATAATNRAAELRAANAALRADVAQLERDLDHVQDMRFIRLEGRAFGLGGKGEIPFALAAGAPELADDAPGSASVRLGADPPYQSPLDAWLDVIREGGRLLVPLTCTLPGMPASLSKGIIVTATRHGDDWTARAGSMVMIYALVGARDDSMNAQLGRALMSGRAASVSRLRRDPHDPSADCWLHGSNCLGMG